MSQRCVGHWGRVAGVAIVLTFAGMVPSAHAAFHLWQMKEVFSNASGSVQFIEMFDQNSFENSVGGFTVTSNSDGVIKTFTFPSSLVGETMNHHMLIATSNFAALSGAPTPDFTFAGGGAPTPFFNPSATNIAITFSGSGDALNFTGASLPKDGIHSLTDAGLPGAQNLISGTNSPTNFGGQSGSINVSPEPGAAILVGLPLLNLFGRRRRTSGDPAVR